MKIKYVKGDITQPQTERDKICIAHCCNNIGKMGSGVARALYEKWPAVKNNYSSLRKHKDGYTLGNVQIVETTHTNPVVLIFNIIGQHDIQSMWGMPPIRYEAITKGLISIKHTMTQFNFTELHLPRIGCGRAGGRWKFIEEIINVVFQNSKIQVVVYDPDDSVDKKFI